ncbi:MAG: sulfurtransferase [Nitrospinales bacterium]
MNFNYKIQLSFLSSVIKDIFPILLVIFCAILNPSKINAENHDFNPLLTIEQFKSLDRGNITILDTRSSWNFLISHIPGANRIGDWQDYTGKFNGSKGILNEDKNFLVNKLRPLGIHPSKTIVLYGDPTNKWRTDGRFFWMFKYLGFKKVAIIEGGFDQWENKGLPIERGTGQDSPPSDIRVENLKFDRTVSADQAWIRSRLKSNSIAIIDTRTNEEFRGATPYGSQRGGHIPGAVNIYWKEFFTDSGLLKSHKELERILEKVKIKNDQEVVVYCTGGVRSAMSFFALRVLGYKVRNYDGSWWDWSRSEPIAGES